MCTNNGEPVQNQLMMRILGALCLGFGIIEMIIGFIVYTFFTDLHLGGWWGAILTVIAGLLAVFSSNRGVVTGTCIVGSIGIVIAIIAAIVDGIASAVFKDFTACCNGDNVCSGSSSGKPYALACISNYDNRASSQCYCTDGSSGDTSWTCWNYELSSGTDCNKILTTYTDELSASTAFLSFGAITLLILSVTTCSALCCAKPTSVNNPVGVAPVIVVSPVAPQTVATVHGQPQVAYVVEPSKY